MKTDRELLELAAKAAGIKEKWIKDGIYIREQFCEVPWNPLEDDVDAFLLMIQLQICIEFGYCADDAPIVMCGLLEDRATWAHTHNFPDPRKQTRRAIVQAAAALGEEK